MLQDFLHFQSLLYICGTTVFHDDDDRSNDWMISVAVPGTEILFRLHTNFSGKEIHSIGFALDISEASFKSIIGKENKWRLNRLPNGEF